MKCQTTEMLQRKINGLIHEIEEVDAGYRHWQREGCYALAFVYRQKLDRLFTELADVNLSFLKEKTSEELHRVLTCAALIGMGVPYNEAGGELYI